MHKKFYEGRTQNFFITTIGTAKTRRVSHPRLKPNGWIMIVQSILQVGVNSADSTEFTGPVEYPNRKHTGAWDNSLPTTASTK